jgi:hypothetical protein
VNVGAVGGRDPCGRGGLPPLPADEPGSYIDIDIDPDRYVYWLTHGEASLDGNESVGETGDP